MSAEYRIGLLLILAAVLPLSPWPLLLLLQLYLIAACLRVGTAGAWLQTLWRLKWLFLSIVILYGWFTPGNPLWVQEGVNLPTAEGLVLAGSRFLLLSALIAAVMWLVKPLGPEQTAAGINKLLTPLSVLRLPVERFSTRMAAALDAVADLQSQLEQINKGSWMQQLVALVSRIERGELIASNGQPNLRLQSVPGSFWVFALHVVGLTVLLFGLPAEAASVFSRVLG